VGLDPLYGQLLAVVRFCADPVEVPLVQDAVTVDVCIAAGVDGENHVLLVQAPAQQRVGAQEQDEQRPRHVVAAGQHRQAGGRAMRRNAADDGVGLSSGGYAIGDTGHTTLPVMSRAPVSHTV